LKLHIIATHNSINQQIGLATITVVVIAKITHLILMCTQID